MSITAIEYKKLKHQAQAWRDAIGSSGRDVIFNPIRDNECAGIPASVLAKKLRALFAADKLLRRIPPKYRLQILETLDCLADRRCGRFTTPLARSSRTVRGTAGMAASGGDARP